MKADETYKLDSDGQFDLHEMREERFNELLKNANTYFLPISDGPANCCTVHTVKLAEPELWICIYAHMDEFWGRTIVWASEVEALFNMVEYQDQCMFEEFRISRERFDAEYQTWRKNNDG